MRLAFLLGALLLPMVARGQEMRVVGTVVRAADGRAVEGASIRNVVRQVSAVSDGQGRFTIARSAGDTIVVMAIGMIPDTSAYSVMSAPWIIRLVASNAALADLVVAAAPDRSLGAGGGGSWRVDAAAARLLPVAVEPDLFRALQLIPAISYSSLLSARPLIRGVDADDAGFAVNGFEAINLYHLGRFYSAFPALGAEAVEVDLQPVSVSSGRSTSGRIGIRGKVAGSSDQSTVQYGLGAVSLATGWDGDVSGWFAGRTARGSVLNGAGTAGELPFGFEDAYLGLATRKDAPAATELTLFVSSDRVGEGATETSLDWRNLLLGVRSRIASSSRLAIEIFASTARHTEVGKHLEARNGRLDVHNEFLRSSAGVDAVWHPSRGRGFVHGGVEFGNLRIVNILSPLVSNPGSIPSADRRFVGGESAGFLEIGREGSVVEWNVGLRVDGMHGLGVVQPRGSLRLNRPGGGWVGIGVGRAARLHHLVSDARTEPKLAYYDLWLPAGEPGVPPATLDHFAIEVGHYLGRARVRGGLFAASGKGAIDLVPPNVGMDESAPFRVGRVRVAGADVDVRYFTASGVGVAVSYALTNAQRDWGMGWKPWVHERTHLLRATGILRPPLGTVFSGTVELGSGYRYTPIRGFVSPLEPDSRDYHAVYGTENSATGPWVMRVDAALVKPFSGLWGLRMEAGVSVTNATFGEASPRYATRVNGIPGEVPTAGSGKGFFIPAIPSLVLRAYLGRPH